MSVDDGHFGFGCRRGEGIAGGVFGSIKTRVLEPSRKGDLLLCLLGFCGGIMGAVLWVESCEPTTEGRLIDLGGGEIMVAAM